MPADGTVVVAGATGKQGGSVVRALLAKGYRVRALTRNPSSPAAISLRDSGVEISVGDMTQEDSLIAAMRGVAAVYAMTTPFQSGHDSEVAQGISMIEAAKAAGIRHFVFSSVASADRSTGIPHFETKYRIEKHLAATRIPFTIIGPTAFMENLIQPSAISHLREGRITRGLPGSRALQLVAVEDIGSFAAHVIDNPGKFIGRRIDIAGDERTGEETAAVLSKVTGRPIVYEGFPPDKLRTQNADLAIMMEWQVRNNYAADINGLRTDYPEIRWHTFEAWAKRINWKALLGG